MEGEWRTEDHDIFLFSFVYILHVFTIFCFRGASLKKNCIILDTESIFINSAVDNCIPIYNAFWLLSTVSSPSSLPLCHAHPLSQSSLS